MRVYVYWAGAFRPLTPWAFARLARSFGEGWPLPCAGDDCPALAERLTLLHLQEATLAIFLCPACYSDFKRRAREEWGLVIPEYVGRGEMPEARGHG